jgi:hypothetical protein
MRGATAEDARRTFGMPRDDAALGKMRDKRLPEIGDSGLKRFVPSEGCLHVVVENVG